MIYREYKFGTELNGTSQFATFITAITIFTHTLSFCFQFKRHTLSKRCDEICDTFL